MSRAALPHLHLQRAEVSHGLVKRLQLRIGA